MDSYGCDVEEPPSVLPSPPSMASIGLWNTALEWIHLFVPHFHCRPTTSETEDYKLKGMTIGGDEVVVARGKKIHRGGPNFLRYTLTNQGKEPKEPQGKALRNSDAANTAIDVTNTGPS